MGYMCWSSEIGYSGGSGLLLVINNKIYLQVGKSHLSVCKSEQLWKSCFLLVVCYLHCQKLAISLLILSVSNKSTYGSYSTVWLDLQLTLEKLWINYTNSHFVVGPILSWYLKFNLCQFNPEKSFSRCNRFLPSVFCPYVQSCLKGLNFSSCMFLG